MDPDGRSESDDEASHSVDEAIRTVDDLLYALDEAARELQIPPDFHDRFCEHLGQTLHSETFICQTADVWDTTDAAAVVRKHPAIVGAIEGAYDHASTIATMSNVGIFEYVDYVETLLVRYFSDD